MPLASPSSSCGWALFIPDRRSRLQAPPLSWLRGGAKSSLGLRVFAWRQPFRANAESDALPPTPNRRGVLFVHGFVCNRGLWNPWMQQLRRNGTPFIAINLEPVLGPIDRYVQGIDVAIARLELATHCPPIIVAHSMGGLAVRAWLRDCAGDHRVHSVITIGTPHAGTLMARFALSANTRQMREGNRWLRALAATESRERRSLFTCYFGHCDNIVFPARNAMLEDADQSPCAWSGARGPGVSSADLRRPARAHNSMRQRRRRRVSCRVPAAASASDPAAC